MLVCCLTPGVPTGTRGEVTPIVGLTWLWEVLETGGGPAQDSERWPNPGVGAEAQCVKWFWSLVFGDVVEGL